MSAGATTAKKPAPRVDLDVVRDRLLKLGLAHAALALEDKVTEAVKETLAPHRFLDTVLQAELEQREERRIRTSLRLSGLPTGQTLGNFDFSFQPSVQRSRIETLGTCAWIREGYNLLLQGPPGVGKTHLAVALGARAVENGFSVTFFRLEDLLADLKRDADMSPNRLRRRKYMNVALLIIDEVGFEPMNRVEASLFFRLVSYRSLPTLARQWPPEERRWCTDFLKENQYLTRCNATVLNRCQAGGTSRCARPRYDRQRPLAVFEDVELGSAAPARIS